MGVGRDPEAGHPESSRSGPRGERGANHDPRVRARHEGVKDWVRRLVEGQGVKLPEEKLFWWGVEMERFLAWCRRQGAEASLEAARAGYGREVLESEPAFAPRRLAQVEQALAAFCRGIDHWRWEATERGGKEKAESLEPGAGSSERGEEGKSRNLESREQKWGGREPGFSRQFSVGRRQGDEDGAAPALAST